MKLLLQLIVLAILVFTGLTIYGLHVGDPNNIINQELRSSFLKSTLTRGVLALNDPGDHKYVYVGPQNDTITIEIDLQQGRVPHGALEGWIRGMIKDTTGKDVQITMNYDNLILNKDSFAYTDLLSLAKKSRDPLLSAQSNYLHILYLSSSSNEPSNAGLVLTATDIFIFKDVLTSLNERSTIQARLEQSTLMHEWGHLLGLEHLEDTNCIMSELVEVYANRKFQGTNIPTQYCPETYFQITKLKQDARKR